MFTSTKTHWQWTKVAEGRWQRHDVEPRREGMMLTEINSEGYRSKRVSVPLSWLQKGYVKEAEEEQIDLLDII